MEQGGWPALLLEASTEVGCLLNDQGELLAASPGWLRAFGERWAPPDQVHSEDQPRLAEAWEACREGRPQRLVVRLRESSDDWAWHQLRLTHRGELVTVNACRSPGRLWHDLLTPLNVVQGFAELLHDGQAGPVGAEQKDYLQEILTAAAQLRDLVRKAAST